MAYGNNRNRINPERATPLRHRQSLLVAWRRFERAQAAKERARLINEGIIRPYTALSRLVKGDDGQWRAEGYL